MAKDSEILEALRKFDEDATGQLVVDGEKRGFPDQEASRFKERFKAQIKIFCERKKSIDYEKVRDSRLEVHHELTRLAEKYDLEYELTDHQKLHLFGSQYEEILATPPVINQQPGNQQPGLDGDELQVAQQQNTCAAEGSALETGDQEKNNTADPVPAVLDIQLQDGEEEKQEEESNTAAGTLAGSQEAAVEPPPVPLSPQEKLKADLDEVAQRKQDEEKTRLNKEAQDKIKSLYASLKEPLNTFEGNLLRGAKKFTQGTHEKAVKDMVKVVDAMLHVLAQNPSKDGQAKFKAGIDALMAKHKETFKATPFIWHDVIKPAFKALLGSVFFILTLGFYGKSFFDKPQSAEQAQLKQELEALSRSVSSTQLGA